MSAPSKPLGAHLDTAPSAYRWTPSPPSEGGEGRGEEGRQSPESPLSPLVPRGEREKTGAVSECAQPLEKFVPNPKLKLRELLGEVMRFKHLCGRSTSRVCRAGQGAGHKDVATTQIYTHVMARPGIGVRSPLDAA